MSKLLQKPWVLVTLSCLVSLLIVEAGLRLLGFNLSYWWHSRYAFVTSDSLRNAAPDVPAYRPNAVIREVAVVDLFGPQVVYDYFFKTNNLGLVQSNDLVCGVPTVALVGDSFTQGTGSQPWVEGLIAEKHGRNGLQIANLAVHGTGVQSWLAALRHYGDCLPIEKVVMIFISGDWYRPLWGYRPQQLACVALTGPCSEPYDLFHPIDPATSQDEIFLLSEWRQAERLGRYGPRRAFAIMWHERLKHLSYSYALVHKFWEPALLGQSEAYPETAFAQNKEAFTAILRTYGAENLRTIFFPTRAEIITGALGPQSRAVLDWLATQDVKPKTCAVNAEDFLELEGHANHQGYMKLLRCTRDVLAEMEVLPPVPAATVARQ